MHPLDTGHPDYEQMQDAGRAPSHHDPILPERRTLIRRRADGFRADVLRGEKSQFEGEVVVMSDDRRLPRQLLRMADARRHFIQMGTGGPWIEVVSSGLSPLGPDGLPFHDGMKGGFEVGELVGFILGKVLDHEDYPA